MASGPQHYTQAEQLAEQAWHFIVGDGANTNRGGALARLALVHAQLAQVASGVDYETEDVIDEASSAWAKAVQPTPTGGPT